MTAHIDLPMDGIRDFCQQWKIIELSLFGSVLRDDFGPDSDVDVLVQFDDGARYSLLDLVKMELELQALFGRPVDLIQRVAVERSENYIRRQEILNSLETVYAA